MSYPTITFGQFPSQAINQPNSLSLKPEPFKLPNDDHDMSVQELLQEVFDNSDATSSHELELPRYP